MEGISFAEGNFMTIQIDGHSWGGPCNVVGSLSEQSHDIVGQTVDFETRQIRAENDFGVIFLVPEIDKFTGVILWMKISINRPLVSTRRVGWFLIE